VFIHGFSRQNGSKNPATGLGLFVRYCFFCLSIIMMRLILYVENSEKKLDESSKHRECILAALIGRGFFYMFYKNKISGLADLRTRNPMMRFPAIEAPSYKEPGINATTVAVPEIVSAQSTRHGGYQPGAGGLDAGHASVSIF
jgi:hypothetical protein